MSPLEHVEEAKRLSDQVLEQTPSMATLVMIAARFVALVEGAMGRDETERVFAKTLDLFRSSGAT